MEIPVNLAYDTFDQRRHALALRSRTFCGLARNHVRSTTLTFDPDDFFACRNCLAALEGQGEPVRAQRRTAASGRRR